MAGVLDSSRYRTFVAMELGVSVQSVAAIVLGGHGDDMVPVRSYCSVGGVPVERLIEADRLNAIEERDAQGRRRDRRSPQDGLGLLLAGRRRGPDGRGVSPRSASRSCRAPRYLEGEYGVRGFYVGVPVQIGGGGVEKVIEIALTRGREEAFAVSVGHVEELVQAMDRVLAGSGQPS